MPVGIQSLSGLLDFIVTQQSLSDNNGLDTITPQQAHLIGPMYAGKNDPAVWAAKAPPRRAFSGSRGWTRSGPIAPTAPAGQKTGSR
jgi:hypothetical protein